MIKRNFSVKISEVTLTPAVADTLIRMSELWEAENITHGYRRNGLPDLEGNRIFLAEKNGDTVGYLFGKVEKAEKTSSVMPAGTTYFEIEELYVLPEYRSQGIGRELFEFCEKEAKGAADFIMLSTATKNSKAVLHFYLDEVGMEFWNARLFKRI